MGLDELLDKCSNHIVMYDKQMHQITQNHIKYYKLKVNSLMFYSCHRVPNLSQFCSKESCLRVNGHFEKSTLNHPK